MVKKGEQCSPGYIKDSFGWMDLHDHKIWTNKNGDWCTYVTYHANERKLIRRKTKEELAKSLRGYYKEIIEYKENFKRLFSEYKELTCFGIRPATYLISPKGDIYSIPTRKWRRFQIDDTVGNYKGQYRVILQTTDGEEKRFYVSRLTLATFKGMPPEDMIDPTVDHINSDPLDNHIENLRWVEREVNSAVRKNRGIGELNSSAKLTQEDVLAICNNLLKGKTTIAQAAEKYGVNQWTIRDIVNHKTWRYITEMFDFEGVC